MSVEQINLWNKVLQEDLQDQLKADWCAVADAGESTFLLLDSWACKAVDLY